jgi:hypothetical protein
MTWGISAAVARGLIGSAGRSGALAGEWEADLPPTWAPDLDQLWGYDTPERPGALASSAAEPVAELEDLGSRRLD